MGVREYRTSLSDRDRTLTLFPQSASKRVPTLALTSVRTSTSFPQFAQNPLAGLLPGTDRSSWSGELVCRDACWWRCVTLFLVSDETNAVKATTSAACELWPLSSLPMSQRPCRPQSPLLAKRNPLRHDSLLFIRFKLPKSNPSSWRSVTLSCITTGDHCRPEPPQHHTQSG